MTPRESLEAAGWIRTPLYQGRWTDPVTKISCSEAAAILTQLARDEAKETSDGPVKEKVQLETVSVRCVSSVAGNIATQNYIQNSIQAAPVATSVSVPDAKKKDAWDIAYPWVEDGAQAAQLAVEIEAYAREYASSSSAALLAANEVIRRQLKKVCDQAEAAEDKVAELQAKNDHLLRMSAAHDSTVAERDALRDSRDRLQGQAEEMEDAKVIRDMEWSKALESTGCQVDDFAPVEISNVAALRAEAERDRLHKAAGIFIDYCEAHEWGLMPEPFDSINPLLKLLGRAALNPVPDTE